MIIERVCQNKDGFACYLVEQSSPVYCRIRGSLQRLFIGQVFVILPYEPCIDPAQRIKPVKYTKQLSKHQVDPVLLTDVTKFMIHYFPCLNVGN
jgi:hypothetical protein